jgi:NDP-sugar pyrophosphorylase family protein
MARVEESVLLDGVQVQVAAVVERSLLGRGVVVGAGAKLTSMTVVGDNEVVAAGTELSGGRVPGGESMGVRSALHAGDVAPGTGAGVAG